jgi:hypothetical protein
MANLAAASPMDMLSSNASIAKAIACAATDQSMHHKGK